MIIGAAPFETARTGHITLAGQGRYLKHPEETGAGAIVMPNGVQCDGRTTICVANPGVAFAHIVITSYSIHYTKLYEAGERIIIIT